jgi:hypothetical protein
MERKETKYVVYLPVGDKPQIVEFKAREEGLDFYYKLLGCDTIDIVRTIDEKLSLVVDDEGLLKENPQPNIPASLMYGWLEHGQPLVGNALLCEREYTDEGVDTVGYSLDRAKELLAMFGISTED